MYTAAWSMVPLGLFLMIVPVTVVKIITAARATGKKDLMNTGLKVLFVSLLSITNGALTFVTYYTYACTSSGKVDYDCFDTNWPIAIQYADYWVLELPPAIAGLAQVYLYLGSSSSSSSSS